jgi:hypothetical protein
MIASIVMEKASQVINCFYEDEDKLLELCRLKVRLRNYKLRFKLDELYLEALFIP